jgi:hypothetical protein
MTATTWRRVSRSSRCPICGKPDWCSVSADGAVAICPRVESRRRCGEAGYLHRLIDAPAGPRRHVRHVRLNTVGPDLGPLAADYRAALDAGRLHQLAGRLGVSTSSLTALRVGWSADHNAYSFPMLDTDGRTVGIRLRRPDGRKFAVRGGREGLFLPPAPAVGERLMVCEGPTDTAALLDLGFEHVVGRPSCTGGVKLLVDLVRRRRPSDVVIVADADEPGRRGADNLASVLLCYCPAVRVIVPPGGVKDVREFLRGGGSRAGLEEVIGAAPARRGIIRGRTQAAER